MKIPPPIQTCALIAATGVLLLSSAVAQTAKVTVDYNTNDEASSAFAFKNVPRPSPDNAAMHARFVILDGYQDQNSGYLDVLHNGKLPGDEDAADSNFFFRPASDDGLLLVDLEKTINVRQVNTYSWHSDVRAPQVYKVYGSDGTAANFNVLPKKGTAFTECGWTLIASVNTVPAYGNFGGQYGVGISNPGGDLGKYRYLLFDISPTERRDPFGHTFYSRIDVIDASAAEVKPEPPAVSSKFDVKTADGKCTITINPDLAPALKDWSKDKLAPVLAEWYPKIVAMLPGEGFTAPAKFKVTLKPVNGVAFTMGQLVIANSNWLQSNIDGEAVGSLVHEMVHVVQQINNYGGISPIWLVEGTADYIRWFKYEPQSHGADIVWMRKQKNFNPRYDASYRISANFLDWVTQKYDKDIVPQVNDAMRQGKYNDDLWKQYTGKTLQDLGAEWKTEIEKQLATP